MEMEITFPGGARVDANFGGFTVKTDQPVQGGVQGSAPTPFVTFLASIGTCAGIYVLGFCQQLRHREHIERFSSPCSLCSPWLRLMIATRPQWTTSAIA